MTYLAKPKLDHSSLSIRRGRPPAKQGKVA